MSSLTLPPLALYVHLPWCVRKCPYCDFNSYEGPGELPVEQYVDCLLADLELDLRWVWGRPVVSIYMGGGTPSLFPPAAMSRLLDGVRARIQVRPAAEITMELNPGTLEHGPLAEYRDCGINRLSMGAQSFSDKALQRLGRIHTARDTEAAFGTARGAGFDNINLDLMYALPGQTLAEAVEDVARASELGPEHLSLYHLTLEPNTPFAHDPPPLPDDDLAWQMQETCQQHLAHAGYRQYEVSAYARDQLECRHNQNYWRFGDYLAIGAGAHGKLTDLATRSIWRYAKLAHPRRYMANAGSEARLSKRFQVTGPDRQFEFMLNAARLTEGFAIEDFEARTGLALDLGQPPWDKLFADGLLQRRADRIQTTDLGWRHTNEVMGRFLPETADAR